MERRDLFKILAATAAAGSGTAADHAAHSAAAHTAASATYTPRCLTAGEYESLRQFCATLLPSDDDGPGALEAGVPWYIDTMLFYGDAATKEVWRQGLASLDTTSRKRHAKGFAELTPAQREMILQELDTHEGSSAQPFFARAKIVVIDGFCQSPAGMKYLGYKGNQAVYTFPGCTHKEHMA